MKKIFKTGALILVAIVLIYFAFMFIKNSKYLSTSRINTGNFSVDVQNYYNIIYANTFDVITADGHGSKVTVIAQNGFGAGYMPIIDVYQANNNKYTKIYRFIPEIPDSEGFHVIIGSITPVYRSQNQYSSFLGLVVSLSKTGADYWGDYPVLLSYETNKGFSLKDFYTGNLGERDQIKKFMVGNNDVIITNKLNPDDSAKSILTQGVSYKYPNIELSFLGDNNCKACEHKMITLSFPITTK